jgi:hypothetical protein
MDLLNDYVMDYRVCSILVPTTYGIEYANQLVLQLNKKIDGVFEMGIYFVYSQFKCPEKCLKKIRLLGDVKILLIKRLL